MVKLVLTFTLICLFEIVSIGNTFEIEPRIVRGHTSRIGQFPYFALLVIQPINNQYGNRMVISRCGATLISDQWLITAAHCLADAEKLIVHLGISQLQRPEPGHVMIPVERENFYFPSQYMKTPHWIDMALIRLPRRVQLTQNIQPVRMPTSCKNPTNDVAYAMGFGLMSDDGPTSPRLLYGVLRILPSDVCRRVFPGTYWSQVVICAHDELNYQSVCKGDSGGGLVKSSDSTLIGVTSFVRPDGCETGAPQGFVNVLPYLKWIKSITRMNLPDC